MVAPRKIRRVVCTVVCVPANDSIETLTDNRPSNRLPWSDPTIARLVAHLQDEVRCERRQAKLAWRTTSNPLAGSNPRADLDPPSPGQSSPANDGDWEWREEPRFTWPE